MPSNFDKLGVRQGVLWANTKKRAWIPCLDEIRRTSFVPLPKPDGDLGADDTVAINQISAGRGITLGFILSFFGTYRFFTDAFHELRSPPEMEIRAERQGITVVTCLQTTY
jgi:hypothetical protein